METGLYSVEIELHSVETGLHSVETGLHEMIAIKYTPHNWLELALHQLQALKQDGHFMDDFLTSFDNIKVEVNLFNIFTIYLLLQNAQ